MGTLSFNGNKTITTGGGGAILTNNAELARHAKHLTTTAKLSHAWEFRHDEIGYNYRLPNLNAALGCAQLESLPNKLAAKRNLFKDYENQFKNIAGISLFGEPINCKSNYWLQTVILDRPSQIQLNDILEATNSSGITTGALVVNGGIGIGGTSYFSGVANYINATVATGTPAGI
jgi:dTDP-4-amino-4,6-dideoxygalactose transaminase